ncbi:MAG TPA: thioesterase family protein [Candidatus Defluviicoccus seviourii]|nr:thioesterase family protein [Candidatus Defluviicoccus seviourii]
MGPREAYRYWTAIPTRFSDNDMLGHINNVVYFRFFESVVVQFLIEQASLNWQTDPIVPFAIDIRCRFCRPLAYPAAVDAGLVIGTLGTSSVRYDIALHAAGEPAAAAVGHFVHVYVDRQTERPVPIPAPIRAVYERFLAP